MKRLINQLISHLVLARCEGTKSVTSEIKRYFCDRYESFVAIEVICSNHPREYLLDIIVTNFSLTNLNRDDPRILLAIESELGGSGGGSQKSLQENVVYDFMKLLLVKSNQKLLIFTSFAYEDEKDHVRNRVNELYLLYKKFCQNPEIVYVIHLEGRKDKNQVSILPISASGVSVYRMSPADCSEI